MAGAFTPTADQVDQFNKLSPADQQKAIKAMQSGQGQALGGPAPATGVQVIAEPEIVKPRTVETDQQLEKTLEKGADAPSLVEKTEVKAVEPPLKQFGYDLFAGTPTTFAPATDIPIPTEYVVGPGDNIQVQLFGKENADYDLVVSREGKLRFPGIGPISVAGLRFDELKSSLETRIKRQMIGVSANITMGTLRSIRIFVLGDVIRPGSYTVSALSNMTNALFVSGGVKPIGSLRNIELKRSGAVITTLDLYDLLLQGDTSNDKRLQPGDVIFVPPIGATVGVAGQVRRPAIYELKAKQSVEDALQFAGGLLATAYPKLTQLERITGKGDRTLVDIDATNVANLKQDLQDGDVVRVYSVLEKMQDIVLVKGHLHRPGGTQWFNGMRLSDIIKSVDELLPKPDLGYVVIRREIPPERYIEVITTRLDTTLEDPNSPDNVVLQPRDELMFFGLGQERGELIKPLVEQLTQQERFDNTAKIVTINGSVHYPGTYPYSRNMRLTDLIRAAYDVNPLTDMEYAVVSRRMNKQGKIEVFPVSLTQALKSPAGDANVRLQERDEVYVFSSSEYRGEEDKAVRIGLNRQNLLKPLIEHLYTQTKQGERAPVVSISGLVQAPGQYPLSPNMHIQDLLVAAGNLTESAYTLGAELSRYKVVDEEYREVNHYNITQNQLMNNAVTDELVLQPYDNLHIKRIPLWADEQIVELKGEIKFPGKYPFRRGETLAQVLKRAGGLTQYAFPEGAVFMREELRHREQQNIDTLAARLETDLAAMSLEQSQDSSKKIDSQATGMANSLLKQLRETKAVGRLVINLEQILAASNDADMDANTQIVLKNGDVLVVPPQTQEVTIIGEVQQTTSHIHNENLSRDDYINLSGGTTYKADEDRIYIVRANGSVVTDESAGWFSSSKYIKTGDTIVVPLDADRMKPLTFWTNITQIVYQLGIAAAAWQTVGVF